ncbi:MAG: hypothetical protein ACUZ8H_14335 [Candidatus Anammoxibacter sp.]
MCNELIIAWQGQETREWFPIGRLQYKDNKYFFKYVNGVRKVSKGNAFVPFGKMKHLEQTYKSDDLFPIFKNRLLQKSRPEYNDYLEWLDLTQNDISPIEELARTGGIRATDSLQLFPVPVRKNNMYEVCFFTHGIRHLPPNYIERINHLSKTNKLYLMKDVQNESDSLALVLRTEDPPEIVGYCPKFFVNDFNILIDKNGPGAIDVNVEKVNIKAPLQLKLLCKLRTPWPDGYNPFEDESFQPVK